MKVALNRFSNTVSGMFSMLFGAAARGSDHQRLTQYIIALNRKKTPKGIISEVALCLKDILNYRLFAFVIKTDDGIDVWLDPRMYRKSLESVVIHDFRIDDKKKINYLNHSFQADEQEQKYSLDNLISYDLNEEYCQAKMYMLPIRNMLDYHDEIVNIILTSTSIALSRQMSIALLTSAAALDPLTGCYNRREFETQINRSVAIATRHKSELSLFMFDLDHFKKVNDTYGHQAGDQVLKTVASLVQRNIRSCDVLARYGGEEFIVILTETGINEAVELADRLRLMISRKMIKTDSGTIRVTASFGVAGLTHNAAMSKLIQDADTMLYKAKMNGRNSVMPEMANEVIETKQRSATS